MLAPLLALLYRVIRPLLFLVDAERVHELVAARLGLLHRVGWLRRLVLGAPPPPAGPLSVRALGRTFASPIGMAAGFDKQAGLYNALGALGFSFVEVGTITSRAQAGNDRPRLFRLPSDRALVNRMGFNNVGAAAAAAAIRRVAPDGVVLGINLGKSKVTPVEEAASDYEASARLLAPLADYLVINVSSPNTPGLRSLQSVDALRPLIEAVRRAVAESGRAVPLLVKIAPDLADEDVDAVADLSLEVKLDGLIATNTTIGRAGLEAEASLVEAIGAGGLSGPPVRERALAVVRRLRARAGGRLTIIGVGGVSSADDAWALIAAGATLVQVYTGFVYGGPGLASRITRGLEARLKRAGLRSIGDLVGRDAEAPRER